MFSSDLFRQKSNEDNFTVLSPQSIRHIAFQEPQNLSNYWIRDINYTECMNFDCLKFIFIFIYTVKVRKDSSYLNVCSKRGNFLRSD